jgi:hypothetical protein
MQADRCLFGIDFFLFSSSCLFYWYKWELDVPLIFSSRICFCILKGCVCAGVWMFVWLWYWFVRLYDFWTFII